jgi:EmrB/QacA subfamily drug resistance transporter
LTARQERPLSTTGASVPTAGAGAAAPATPTGPAAGAGTALRVHRGPVLVALMLSTALVAIDSTIVATAVPNIVRDLGGFAQFPWLFSIYLLTQAVTVPLYGRFADVIGRKPVLLLGIGLFVAGSVLCGAAWSMLSLIVFRGLQGIGAGAVLPITITIVGDLYTVEERARVQGFLASVWGASAVLGPTLGGIFSDFASWRWIFFVNVPIAGLAVWMLTRHFSERVTRRQHRIDFAGAGTLMVGCSLLILGLLEGGTGWAWGSAQSLVVFVVGGLLLVAFVAIERRAAEPVLPLWVLSRRTLLAGNLAALAIGAITMGLSSYVPTYAQGVKGTGALIAGFTLAALTVGWPLSATFAGRFYVRIGFRDTALLGGAFTVAGGVLLVLLGQSTGLWAVAVACFVVGVGLGFCSTAVVVAIQSVVGWDRRGVVTGTNMFTRSIGSAVGVAVLGAIANSTLAHRLAHPPAALAGRLPRSVDTTSLVLGGTRPADRHVAAYLRGALFDATHHIFWALVVVAAIGALCVLVMPRRTTELVFDAPHEATR